MQRTQRKGIGKTLKAKAEIEVGKKEFRISLLFRFQNYV